MDGEIWYQLEQDSTSKFSVQIATREGSHLWLTGSGGTTPSRSGTQSLTTSDALCLTAWAYGQAEYALSRCHQEEKREQLRRLSGRQRKAALTLAMVADSLTAEGRKAWCSACMQFGTHRKSNLGGVMIGTYSCMQCGASTIPCALPTCRNMALRGKTNLPGRRYCAEHRHDIPGFAKANRRLPSLLDYKTLLAYDKHNASRSTRLAIGTVVAGAIVGPAAYFAAPVLGGALGASSLGGGLSGAAATSHGLAMLGGGSLAAGGAGMAGGVVVVTAAGTGLGGALGLGVVNAYVQQDKSFAIEQLRDGEGPPVLLASGFLTENDDGWGTWRQLIDRRYPDSPVYRVFWGAKDLAALSAFLAGGGTKLVIKRTVVTFAQHASKQAGGPLALLSAPLLAADLLKNPWHVARARADMTGAVLADLIARSPGQYILVGHSLGGAVMLSTAQALGTRSGDPKIEAVHVLGAAASAGGDWHPAGHAVARGIWNYYSTRDPVLSKLFTTAQGGKHAVGNVGMNAGAANIHDINVSESVGKHGDYTSKVHLE